MFPHRTPLAVLIARTVEDFRNDSPPLPPEWNWGEPDKPHNWLFPNQNPQAVLAAIREAIPTINAQRYAEIETALHNAIGATLETMTKPDEPHHARAITIVPTYQDKNRPAKRLLLIGDDLFHTMLEEGKTLDDFQPFSQQIDDFNRKNKDKPDKDYDR